MPVRFYGSDQATLHLDVQTTAVMVVDANSAPDHPAVIDAMAAVLQCARAMGMRVFYFHEDGYGTGGPADITRELHGERHGRALDALFLHVTTIISVAAGGSGRYLASQSRAEHRWEHAFVL